jgi:cell division protein FtsA
MPRVEIIAGLDIGTTKVCLAVAKRQFGPAGSIELLGSYKVDCDSLRAGCVGDLCKLSEAIGVVLEKAQNDTGFKISSAFVNIEGMHIAADYVRGRVNILNRENEISKRDLDAAYNNAKVSLITYDREPLLVVPQDYIVDGQVAIKNPVGLFGSKLDVDYLFITGSTPAIENLCKAVNMGGLEIEEMALSNLASSYSVLTSTEKDLGAILVDIGGSVSEVSVFSEGLLRYDRMLGQGAEFLTAALTAQLKVQPDIASKILRNYCKVNLPVSNRADQDILIKETVPPRTITESQLQKIIEPKVKELICAVKDAIQACSYSSMASSGVVLIGGISAIDGLAELAEGIFNMPVRVGLPKSAIYTNIKALDSITVAAVGLIEYGCQKRKYGSLGRQLSDNVVKRVFQVAKDFIYEYF